MLNTDDINMPDKLIYCPRKLTNPTIAEARNFTKSIGVNPGFFFYGCQVTNYGHSLLENYNS